VTLLWVVLFWDAMIWGGTGGLIVEALEFYTAITRTNALPWQTEWRAKGELGLGVLIVSVIIRIMVGALFAGAVARGGGLENTAAALFAGAAAPTLILEKLGRSVKGFGQQIVAQPGDVKP
jgi:hypothetical protein